MPNRTVTFSRPPAKDREKPNRVLGLRIPEPQLGNIPQIIRGSLLTCPEGPYIQLLGALGPKIPYYRRNYGSQFPNGCICGPSGMFTLNPETLKKQSSLIKGMLLKSLDSKPKTQSRERALQPLRGAGCQNAHWFRV